MRDPKTHAKVLTLRANTVYQALLAARSEEDVDRCYRLADLSGAVEGALSDHEHRTGWAYLQWTTTPHWRHITIIPDTEENAS